MDVNKAEFHMLKIQRKMEQNKSNIRRATKQLNLLNGGVQLDFEADKYPWFPEISLDSIIEQKVESWPALQIANKRHMIAEKNVELEKSLNGPEFNIGYGSETVGNSSFRGILVGASVPLWTNKNKVEAAKAETIYMEEEYQSKQMSMETKTQKLYETCSYLQNSLKDYEEAIKELKGTELLRKSMQLEQISVLDFYREVEYFYDIYDEYLKLERDYYLAQTELYRYKL
jgi:outer membrane protein TolC